MAAIKEALRELFFGRMLPALKNTTTKRLSLGFSFFILVTLLLSLNFMPERLNLKQGQVSPRTIKATRSIEFVDRIKTEEAKRLAVQSVGKAHDENPAALTTFNSNIVEIMNKIRAVQANSQLNQAAKAEKLKQEINLELPPNVYQALAIANPAALQNIETRIKAIAAAALRKGIKEENLENTVQALQEEEVAVLPLAGEYKSFIGAVIRAYLPANFIYNKEATDSKIEAAREAVTPIRVTVQQGEKIIGEGDIVSAHHIQKLEALGLLKAKGSLSAVIGLSILVAVGMALVMIYLHQYRKHIYDNEGLLFLLGLIVVSTLVLAKTISAIDLSSDYTSLLGYLFPVAAAAMLIAILLDSRLALIVVPVISIMLGIITGNDMRVALVSMIGGMVGVYGVSRLSTRSDLAKAGLLHVSVANVVSIVAVELATRGANTGFLAGGLMVGILNGLFSAVLTIGLLPFLESAFGIVSAVKLLELSNPGQPLLKKLMLEAPGTYHHSIIVGNLAEAAADAVGGESLLVRVGALYHDIGKIKRPYFFIENQLSCENPHEKIAPTLSTLIITSHTKDGVELAREAKMPRVLQDIIEQHHGTGLVSFFFHRALENDKNEKTVTEEDFRYEGPKPQTKEAALVMMADSVEAAVRSLQKPTPGRIEGVVRRIIKEKLHDGQLDECDLNFKDLDVIANAFVRVLSGIFHARVEYPETVIKEIERRKARDASVRK